MNRHSRNTMIQHLKYEQFPEVSNQHLESVALTLIVIQQLLKGYIYVHFVNCFHRKNLLQKKQQKLTENKKD